jgi:NDP-sugar pyrophosphorylase family protein
VTDVVLSCSYMVDEVRRTMGDGAAHGVALRYAVESEPLGTAGGVRNAMDLAPGGGLVVVLNGDVLTDADLTAMHRFHRERGAAATIYLTRVPDPSRYGLVDIGPDGRVRDFVEKPPPGRVITDTVNAGIYLLDRSLLGRIPGGRMVSIEREFFPGLLAAGIPFYGWVAEHYWLDIGSPASYLQAQRDLLAGKVSSRLGPGDAAGQSIALDVAVGPTVTVTGPCVIGAGSRLGPGCRVGPGAVLGPGCRVGQGASVEDAMLWEDVEVGDGAVLRTCIVGSRARIGAGARVGPDVTLEADALVPPLARLPG